MRKEFIISGRDKSTDQRALHRCCFQQEPCKPSKVVSITDMALEPAGPERNPATTGSDDHNGDGKGYLPPAFTTATQEALKKPAGTMMESGEAPCKSKNTATFVGLSSATY